MNRIIFRICDGAPQHSEWNGIRYITYAPKIFEMKTKMLETNKVLVTGDNINYQGWTTKILERTYYPDLDSFDFWCSDIYTGRSD
jgi:hypothetical protein